MTDMNAFNQQIIEEFRGNGGKVGGNFEGAPMLVLHSTGAKSGAERLNPMMYQKVGDNYAVFASKGGAPTNPDWFHNLVAHPQVEIEVGSKKINATAKVLAGEARNSIWESQKVAFPQFAEYETKTDRVIPVVLLEPADS